MRRRLVLGALVAITAVCACADILGIDDGKVRTEDASTIDAPADVTIADAATDAPADVAVEAATSPLACGKSTCNALTEACCRTGDPADASAQSFACVSADAGCAGLRVTCDDPSTCAALGHAGDVCCGEVDGGTYATDTACVAPGTCSGVVMCAAGDDELCAAGDSGKTCQPSIQTVIGFLICK